MLNRRLWEVAQGKRLQQEAAKDQVQPLFIRDLGHSACQLRALVSWVGDGGGVMGSASTTIKTSCPVGEQCTPASMASLSPRWMLGAKAEIRLLFQEASLVCKHPRLQGPHSGKLL